MSKAIKALNKLREESTEVNSDVFEWIDKHIDWYCKKIEELKNRDKGIADIYDNENKMLVAIKQALNQSERNEKFKNIVISKCIGTKNLIYVTICENYNDYLSLFEDKIEEQYLLTEDEFNFLKEILKNG